MLHDLSFFRAAMPESSALATGADDALKDLDNTWPLLWQPEDVRRAWFDRIRILRLVDRLAEDERCDPEPRRFTRFCGAWTRLRHEGVVDMWGLYADEMVRIHRLWVTSPDHVAPVVQPLTEYIYAVHTYGFARRQPVELECHTAMLGQISGNMFRLFPFVRDEDRITIWHFGALDGFFNNLRDLAEDSAAGLCYFPADVLERHGLTRDDALTGRCIGTAGWERMMRFWLDEYMPTLLERAQPFIDATGLHPSLEALRGWCMHRWRRVESVFREVEYEYCAFDVLYWDAVRRELVGEEAA